MTPERESRFSLRPSPRKRQRRTIRSFADAVVRRRAMQTRVEVAVGFVGPIRPGAEDGSEVGAGNSGWTRLRAVPSSCCFTEMLRPSASVTAAMSAYSRSLFQIACFNSTSRKMTSL